MGQQILQVGLGDLRWGRPDTVGGFAQEAHCLWRVTVLVAGLEGYGYKVACDVVEQGRGGVDEPVGDGADLGGRLRLGECGEVGSQIGER
ncbi:MULTISPECIES: hypothetical protein [Streptomyces]|uniref:hypothetical protein n=1 Tax=Streptomyces TaxID=1883 RepID=UPI002249115A|nr:hypothetical protein [Streptomyces sp. JHD 1]MCX2969454.1 hypothetical protein [Streptomyces sp. JHD 1]